LVLDLPQLLGALPGREHATGKVTGLCKDRHRHQEFLAFFQHVARAYPERELHLVMDNYATHVCPESEVMEM